MRKFFFAFNFFIMLVVNVAAHKGDKVQCSLNAALLTFGTVFKMSRHLDVILGHNQLIDFFLFLLFAIQFTLIHQVL